MEGFCSTRQAYRFKARRPAHARHSTKYIQRMCFWPCDVYITYVCYELCRMRSGNGTTIKQNGIHASTKASPFRTRSRRFHDPYGIDLYDEDHSTVDEKRFIRLGLTP